MKYKIKKACTCHWEYEVEADSEEEAYDKLANGEAEEIAYYEGEGDSDIEEVK